MKAAWYNSLSLREKEKLCLVLNQCFEGNTAQWHPGNLVFFSQQKLADLILQEKDQGELYKLFSTCGECGKELPAHKKQVSSGWLYSTCLNCAIKTSVQSTVDTPAERST